MSEPLALGRPSVPQPPDRSLLTHRRLLGSRLNLHVRLRFMTSVALLLGAGIAQVLPAANLPAPIWVASLALFLGLYNAIVRIRIRRLQSPESSADANRFLQQLAYFTVVIDYLGLTLAIWLTGGARSPFMPFYLLHLVVSHLLISPRRALYCLALAYALVFGLVVGEYTGVDPNQPILGLPEHEIPPLSGGLALSILVAYAVLFGSISYLLRGLSVRLRNRELKLHSLNQELALVSSMRRQFLHIALHNLQTPLGAVRMMLRNLKADLMGPTNEQQKDWITRGLNRIDSLGFFLHDLQIMSELDEKRLSSLATAIRVEPMLSSLAEELDDMVQERKHTLNLNVEDGLPTVRAVDRLLREAISNYITNAIKYTPVGGTITISAFCKDGWMHIEVADTGVGISLPDRARLFREFVRVGRHSQETTTEGSGLGLSIVKRVVESHGGKVWCKSELGQGSIFGMALPLDEGS